MDKTKILLVGCGKMGMALLQGWLRPETKIKASNIYVVDPFANAKAIKNLGVNFRENEFDLPDDFDFCIIAVKPQIFNDTLKLYTNLVNKNCCFISIAAGKTVSVMESILGKKASIIRTMPNIAANVNQAATGMYVNDNVTESQQAKAHSLFNFSGGVLYTRVEKDMDIITAISGSGPAYVFYIIDILTKIGEDLGLEEQLALRLAKQTFYGASVIAQYETHKSPVELMNDVTSKGGTTEAALDVLMEGKKLEKLLQEAVEAAIDRAKELQ